jgi:hypothetical protein
MMSTATRMIDIALSFHAIGVRLLLAH